jgi:uncharacterized glyoxalase superfamily protein PhnB
MANNLFRVVLPVPDVAEAVDFYAALLEDEGEAVGDGSRHYFHCDGAILALANPAAHGNDVRPNAEHVYLAVEDIDAAYTRARLLSAPDLTEIAEQPWGERSFYCKDRFGNPLCFVDEATKFTGDRG